MRLLSLAAILVLYGMISVGCATKNYVRTQTGPVVDKINELDDLTAQNTHEIRDVDARVQQRIQQVNTQASAADQKALAASAQANQAQSTANQAVQGVNGLTSTVANLDNYKPIVQTTVHFGFDRYELTPKARKALDQLGAEIAHAEHYIVVVDGNTDSAGPAGYNYLLSQRRADEVINYLAAKYNVPAHKIYLIGLGKDKPASSNSSAKGRAENRRVDVRLMTNLEESTTSAQVQSPTVQH
jgi:outer membrane protein OmpA-like peptidoglycan-associated protein